MVMAQLKEWENLLETNKVSRDYIIRLYGDEYRDKFFEEEVRMTYEETIEKIKPMKWKSAEIALVTSYGQSFVIGAYERM